MLAVIFILRAETFYRAARAATFLHTTPFRDFITGVGDVFGSFLGRSPRSPANSVSEDAVHTTLGNLTERWESKKKKITIVYFFFLVFPVDEDLSPWLRGLLLCVISNSCAQSWKVPRFLNDDAPRIFWTSCLDHL